MASFWRTLPFLLLALVCICGVTMLLVFGFPVPEFKYAVFTVLLVGPWLVLYIGMWVYLWKRSSERPHLVIDEDHGPIGLTMLSPEKHRTAEVDGKRLPSRQGLFSNSTVYISLGHEVEQRERVNENGETETYRQRVIRVPWEGIVPPLKVAERWEAYSSLLEKVVPRLQAARKARASVDTARIDATDQAMLGVLRGAEHDQFIDESANPFDLDLGEEDREFGDLYDEDLATEDEPDPASADAQPDGGENDAE